MNLSRTYRNVFCILAALALSPAASAAELPYSNVPLSLPEGVQPNVALMIDTSGSMSNAGSHDTGASYPYVSNCNGTTVTQPSTYTDITRLEAAKQAACQVATDNATSMRIGVYHFNNFGDAGQRSLAIGTNTATTIKAAIQPLTGQNGTPLTSVMDTIVRDYAGASSPIQYRCQKNYVVFFTDGDPNTGYDLNSSYAFPSLDTQQSSGWTNSTAASGYPGGSQSWDGFTDPAYNPAGSDVYPWLDDLTQFAYDVDFKTGASPALTTALCGFSMTGVAGKDCSGKSWNGTDDVNASYVKQNIITHTVGFGSAANNGLLRNSALVNQIPLVPADIDTANDTITVLNHGLTDGQFVHYYKTYAAINGNTIATANTTTDMLSGDTLDMQEGDSLTYNNEGGTSLEYVLTPAVPAVPAITCADANATMGLTSGNSYYVASMTSTILRLATSAANADLCDNYSNGNSNVSTYCIDLVDRSLNSLVHTFTRAAVPGTPFIPGTPDIPAVPPAPVVPALAPSLTLSSPYLMSKINPSSRIERIKIADHGLVTGQRLVYSCDTGGTACPAGGSGQINGLTMGTSTYYFAAVMTSGEFRLATSAANAALCDDYADNNANVTTYCVDITNPTSTSTTLRTHTFTAYTEGTPFVAGIPDVPAVDPIPAVVASFTADGIGSSPIDQNALTEAISFPSDHNLLTQDLVSYTCSGGAAEVPAVPAVTGTRSSYYARNVIAGNPGSFQLSLIQGGSPVDIAIAGNAGQTFSWNGNIAQAMIGGLYAYETDAEPDATPNPAVEPAARGKYYVELVDADKFKLRQCGNTVDCTSEGAIADLTSTGYGRLSTGPGKSFFATTASELSAALNASISAISADQTKAPQTLNSSYILGGDKVYTAQYHTADWSGDVVALNVDPVTGNVIQTPPVWLASEKVPAPYSSRNVFTWNGTAGMAVNTLANLTAAQQMSLGYLPTEQQKVLDWVLGKDDAALIGSRTRPKLANGTDINVYGDILNSNPVYVSASDQNYETILPPGTPGKSTYLAFKSATPTRTPMLYVGANDGMVHGINANTGAENFGFIPNGVFTDWVDIGDDALNDDGEIIIRKFYELTRENYGNTPSAPHRYFVDGEVSSGDAFFTSAKAGIAANSWHTVLVGGLGKGGRSIYALDVTDPTSFGVNNVLWEFGPAAAGKMGYSYGKPQIARLQTGQWAAIFGNGYDGNTDLGRLFIVNLETGATIKRIDATGSKGLSSVSVLKDATGTAVAVYAGDLLGNVWKFDISDANIGNWPTTTGVPFFVARDSTGNNGQAITTSITLGSISPNATCAPGKVCTMLYFGTGSYFQDSDRYYNAATAIPKDDTFYALLDNGTGNIAGKSNLVQQTILSTTTINGVAYRNGTQYAVDYTGTNRGWYMNLVVGGYFQGERVNKAASLSEGRLIFSTIIPSSNDPCVENSSAMFMEVDALTGAIISPSFFDTNVDGLLDFNDYPVVGFPSSLLAGKDADDDGVASPLDNCPLISNAMQLNTDGDSQGDVCDEDDDNDGLPDMSDNCPLFAHANQLDIDSDGMGDVCDQDDDNDGVNDIGGNIAIGKLATQSSDYDNDCSIAAKAVDGNTNDDVSACSSARTQVESQPWWQVDLGAPYMINTMTIWMHGFSQYNLATSTDGVFGLGSTYIASIVKTSHTHSLNQSIRYIRIGLTNTNSLNLAEVQVFMPGETDNCPLMSNANQLNTDADLQGDVCDEDDDNDGMPDVWEMDNGINPLVNDAADDADGDGYTNAEEYKAETNPQNAESHPLVSVKNDYNNDGIAGWIWKGQSNGVETQSQNWQLTFPLYSPNWGIPNRFYTPIFPDQANWELVTSGDFNKDGDADILWRHLTSASWKVWQMQDGLRAAQNSPADFDLAHEWQVIGAGDTDKDGDDDVILNNATTGDVLIWEMQNHAIANTHTVGTKAGHTLNRIGDFNKDGDVDLLFRENGTDVLVIWELQSNTFVLERALANTGTGYSPVCTGDFDNDGDDDIMLVNSTTLQEKWFVMESYARTQTTGSTNVGFVFKGCGDYDGDGDADSLWQRLADDANRVVLQQNYGVTKQTVYTNAFGGANGFVYRGNSN